MAKKKKQEDIKPNVTYLETTVPYIHNHEELASYLRPIYIIENVIKSHEEYDSFMKKLTNLIRGSFVIRECREYPIKFKFYQKDEKTYTLQLRHFFINMILWRAFIELDGLNVLNESFILDCDKDIPNIEDYINYKLIDTLRDYHIKSTTINYTISEILYNLRSISLDFSQVMNLNFTLKTFIDVYQNNQTIHDLMESKFDRGMQPYEIEDLLHKYEDEEIKAYKALHDNPIGVILRAGTGIKTKQLVEFTIAEGLKPTLTGETIPWPVENSTLIRGADRPSYHYISAISSRKSLVMNKLFVHIKLCELLGYLVYKDNQQPRFYINIE